MPILMKEIVPEGTFLVSSNKGRIKRDFPKEYLDRIAITSNAMLAAGLRIPAPFNHSKDAKPIEVNKEPSSAFNNAGYWTHFFVATDSKGKATLNGVLDSPGSKDDPATPYYKALNTNKEVSLSVHDTYKDGLEREWKDGIIHVALVHNAVVPGQKEFEELTEGSTIINMSMYEQGEESLIEELKISLRDGANISLPDSCNATTFLRDLLVAVSQLKFSKPSSDTIEPVPIYMSIGDTNMAITQLQAESLVASKAINPVTKIAFTMEDLGFKPVISTSVDLSTLQSQLTEKDTKLNQAIALLTAFKNKFVEDTKNAIQRRINDLVAKKIITQDFADKSLVPKIEFQMSIDPTNAAISEHPLQLLLSTFEAMPSAQTKANVFPQGGTVQINDLLHEGSPDLEGNDLENAYKLFEEFI